MTVQLRRAGPADANAVGDICYRAFKAIADAHRFPPDFPSCEVATELLSDFLGHKRFYAVVAERAGEIVGSNFLDLRNSIGGIGPVTVDPSVQDDGAGRALMEAVMKESQERQVPGIRLVQAGYHTRSLALYLKLGFQVREHLVCLQGAPTGSSESARFVRPASGEDLTACSRLCMRVHGHDRDGELGDAVARGTARVVERAGRVTGYATSTGFLSHAVGESNADLEALIGASKSYPGPGFLVPTRNSELVQWCLRRGLRIVQPMTLMTIGLYNWPSGAWLPSVTY